MKIISIIQLNAIIAASGQVIPANTAWHDYRSTSDNLTTTSPDATTYASKTMFEIASAICSSSSATTVDDCIADLLEGSWKALHYDQQFQDMIQDHKRLDLTVLDLLVAIAGERLELQRFRALSTVCARRIDACDAWTYFRSPMPKDPCQLKDLKAARRILRDALLQERVELNRKTDHCRSSLDELVGKLMAAVQLFETCHYKVTSYLIHKGLGNTYDEALKAYMHESSNIVELARRQIAEIKAEISLAI